MDRDFKNAVEAGERNLATLELVRNWCAHARIEKSGGVGMIEQVTGLPIGHHSVACDHAGGGKVATWDLREAALDFYDRHCVDCKHRKPVGFPNLSKLVQERDNERAEVDRRTAFAEEEAAKAFEARRDRRGQLKRGLTALSAAIVDHIDELDERRDAESRAQLIESARLAPEHFGPPIIDYLFELAGREPWFTEPGLAVLHHLPADPLRLARLALVSAKTRSVTRTAVAVLLDRVAILDEALIPPALPAIIEVASPDDGYFFMEHRPPAEPELLLRLWEAYPRVVRDGIDVLLASRRFFLVELGGRGILVLDQHTEGVALSFARAMISKFIRAAMLLDDFNDDRGGFRYLRDAILVAFRSAPEEIDALIQEYMAGSDAKSRERGFKLYERALRSDRLNDEPVPVDSTLHRIAFNRLLWAPTIETSDEVLRLVQGTFQGGPYTLKSIAAAELDNLLGAALLLDDRLRQHESVANTTNDDFLRTLEHNTRGTTLVSLMCSYLEWASKAADGDVSLINKIVALFEKVPEGRDHLRGAIINTFGELAGSVNGLSRILPHLYYGLVGPSALMRSYSATAFGESRHTVRENVPPLVFESFVPLLRDSYVVVHKAAARALQRFELPKHLRGAAAEALLDLVRYYGERKQDWNFVVDCIETLAYELHRRGIAKGEVGKYLVRMLIEADPLFVKSELRGLMRTLGETDGFADLVIRLLPEIDDHSRRNEDVLDALDALSAEAIFARRDAFEQVGKELGPRRPWIACHIVEALGRASAWSEAQRVAQAGVDELADTIENRSRRTFSRFLALAASLENAIASGRSGDVGELRQQWDKNTKEKEEYEEDANRRDSRSSFPYSR